MLQAVLIKQSTVILTDLGFQNVFVCRCVCIKGVFTCQCAHICMHVCACSISSVLHDIQLPLMVCAAAVSILW